MFVGEIYVNGMMMIMVVELDVFDDCGGMEWNSWERI